METINYTRQTRHIDTQKDIEKYGYEESFGQYQRIGKKNNAITSLSTNLNRYHLAETSIDEGKLINIFSEMISDKYYYSLNYIRPLIPEYISYSYNNEIIGNLPNQLSYLLPYFKNSEAILFLEDNWDDNGSESYNFETWKSTIKFIIDYATALYIDFNKKIDEPRIYNGPNGSIDILWENESYTLLININKDAKEASFYADNTNNTQKIRGEFNLNDYKKNLIPLAIQL